jgi:hypothetical protein
MDGHGLFKILIFVWCIPLYFRLLLNKSEKKLIILPLLRKPKNLARNSPVSKNITYLSFIFMLVINITWQSKRPYNSLFVDLLNEVHIFVMYLLHVVLNWRRRILIMYTGSRSGSISVYMSVFDALRIEHLRMDPFRAGQLQPTGVSHNLLGLAWRPHLCVRISKGVGWGWN